MFRGHVQNSFCIDYWSFAVIHGNSNPGTDLSGNEANEIVLIISAQRHSFILSEISSIAQAKFLTVLLMINRYEITTF
ncbi:MULTISPECIES: hypothetical protein [Acinetobacter]|uniref:hypothetical protein n=1 Tax=Acinetobacter TaxID=469 RepID=UPI00131548FF|nr:MULTISPECIES: hypothetical protein [Acinetobacter]